MALNEKKAREVLFGETENKAVATDATATDTDINDTPVVVSPGQTKVGAVARLVVLLVAIINQICTILGLYTLPAMNENTSQLISLVLVVASALYGYWMNNSWTDNAKFGDQIMDALQKGDITIADIFTILAKISDKSDKTDDTKK